MKRAWVVVGVAVAAIVAVVLVKCRGGERPRPGGSSAPAGAGSAAMRPVGARDPAPDPRTSARGSIRGVVTGKGKGPLAGAQVCATAWIERMSDDAFRQPRCTTTDAQGRYGFDELYAGRYWIDASAPTYLPAGYRGPAPERDETIRLAAGQARAGIDLELAPGGVEVRGTVSDISGGPIADAWVSVGPDSWYRTAGAARARTAADGTYAVWTAPGGAHATAHADGYADGDARGQAPTARLDILLTPESVLAGTVVDAASGAPVPDATVMIEPDWRSGEGGGSRRAQTDAKGAFRIARLAPGRYKPTATALGRWGEPADSVLLGLGQTVEGMVIPVHAVRVVTGRIVIDGAAAGSGAAQLPGCERGWLSLATSDRQFHTTSEPDGAIRIDAIVPGTYHVAVQCAGFTTEDAYPDVVVADADVVDQLWRVHPGATLRGAVKTTAGVPVADAMVQPRPVGGDPRSQAGWDTATTEADGSFELRGLVPATYKIELVADDHPAPRDPPEVVVAAGKDTTVDIVVDDGGAIAGIVVDERGQPVRGARVEASGARWEWRGDQRTSDDGTFTLAGLVPGSYRVTASRGWTEQLRRPGSTDDDLQGERATVVAGQTARVRLVVESEAGRIAGTVADAAGAPVPDAYIAAERESDGAGAAAGAAARQSRWGWWNSKKPVVTDATGGFEVTELAAGTYTVRAYRRGGGEAIAEHVAVGTTRARLVLASPSSIAGTVALSGGGHPDDFSITANDPRTGFRRTERFFRTGGAFTLSDLPAGTYRVWASAAAGQAETEVAVASGEHKAGVALELIARVTVRGRILALDDHAPVPGMMVMVTPLKGGSGPVIMMGDRKEHITDAKGEFIVEDAPAGRVVIQGFPRDFDDAKFGYLAVPTVIPGGAAFDAGDLYVPRRQISGRDRGGDLGFTLAERPPDQDPEKAELAVATVRAGGPAAKAGLVVGDVIVSTDGHDVRGAQSYLAWSLWDVPVGAVVTLGLARGATISITAGPQP